MVAFIATMLDSSFQERALRMKNSESSDATLSSPFSANRFKSLPQGLVVLRTCATFRQSYWLTPLARKPPSTTRVCPVTKDAASEHRYTAAPTSSSVFPNRPMGVRANNSLPRGVLSSRSALSAVWNTPGAIAFTVTPRLDHSTASERVSETTPDLLAA